MNSNMEKRAEAGEIVLYKYGNGQVLISDKRIKLGMESWPIEAVEDAKLVANQVFPARLHIADMYTSNIIALGSILGMGGMLICVFMQLSASYSGVLLGLAIILIVSGLGVILYGVNKPQEAFSIRLKTESVHGRHSWCEAVYKWHYKLPAEKTLLAIQEALASGSGGNIQLWKLTEAPTVIETETGKFPK